MKRNNLINILIADDQRLFRSGVISLLENVQNITVVDECSDGEELIKKYFDLNPGMIVTNITLPTISGFDAFKEIKKLDPKLKALFLTMYDTEDYVFYANKIGANGLIGKNISKNELVLAINTVSKGNKYFGMNWTKEALNKLDEKYRRLGNADIDPELKLSARDKKILFLISEGKTSNEIADILDISKRTVDNHRHRMMKTLKINSLTELIAFAIKFAFAKKVHEEID